MGLAKLTGTVSIPSTVTIAGNIFKVTSIADKAFMQNTDIINVKVGNSITQIGQQAFYKCANLEIVNLEIMSYICGMAPLHGVPA